LLTSFLSPASGVGQSINKAGNWSNSIALTETSVTPDGNYLVRVANNSGEELTISNVKIGDTNADYSQDLFQGNAQNFVIDSSDACSTGDGTTNTVTITYVTRNGITKTEVYPAETYFSCENYTVSLLADQCTTYTTRTLDGSTVTGLAGYYAAFNLSTIDADLATANIKGGSTIFGVAGNSNVVNTSSGTASATEILDSYVAWVDGSEVTGSVVTQTLSAANDTVSAGYYVGTTLSTVDSDLIAANISSGVTIFGVTGTYEGSGGGDPGIGFIEFSAQSYSSTDGGATVTDSANGLVWQASSYNSGSDLAWQTAMDYCNNNTAGLAGTGWRLPNMAEIGLLYNYSSWSMYGSSFSNNTDFWSSTTVPSDASSAYGLFSDYGSIYPDSKTGGSFDGARCVRSE